MKKATLNTIYSWLLICSTASTVPFETNQTEFDTVMTEIEAELNKGAEAKAQKASEYEAVKDLIVSTLSDTPVTCGELYDSIKDELPDGFSKGKVQYALTHLWQDEIVKIEGKPNTYRRA